MHCIEHIKRIILRYLSGLWVIPSLKVELIVLRFFSFVTKAHYATGVLFYKRETKMMIFRSKKDKASKNQPSDNDSVGSNNSTAEPPYLKKVRKLKLNIDFERMVNLPPLVDENEWLATHGG